MAKKKIAHIVPAMNIGGVEVGIHKSYDRLNEEFDYRVFYIRKKGNLNVNQKFITRFLWMWFTKEWRPDVVVTSLWWAHLIGWFCKIFHVKWVAFFHNENFSHVMDRYFTPRAWRKADYRLVDSNATKNAMQKFCDKAAFLVPYIFPFERPADVWTERSIDFIWVGRAVPAKRLDLLEKFLAIIESLKPDARITLALAGEVPQAFQDFLLSSILKVTVENNVASEMVRTLLLQSRFYMLFSDREGMSMSTVEAVQAGCIVITRPVGEIPTYLESDISFWLSDTSQKNMCEIVAACLRMDANTALVERMRNNSSNNLKKLSNYTDSMILALRSICRK